jgi:hypothetical protein
MEVIGWSFQIDKKPEYLSADTTYLRPLDLPVEPERDLVLAEKKEEVASRDAKSGESSQDSSSTDLLDPGNTIN